MQILNDDKGTKENVINLSIGISNQYGEPKKAYYMHIRNGIIKTDTGIINVRHGDIISIVYIRWMVLKTGSKRIIFS